jgi:hypothetical protein
MSGRLALRVVELRMNLYGRSRGADEAVTKKKAEAVGNEPEYADRNRNVWGGMTPRPKWLHGAVLDGKKPEDFLAGAGSADTSLLNKGASRKPTERHAASPGIGPRSLG